MGNLCCAPEEDFSATTQKASEMEPLTKIELPPGWKAVPSKSRPGEIAYQNIHTGERIAWLPTEEAKTYKGGIKKRKKKKAPAKSNGTSGEGSEEKKTEVKAI